MLIISSDTDPVYAEHRKVWSSYMNSNSQIECYFIQYRDGIQAIEGNTFWLNGVESFPAILAKTLDSVEYFLKNDYDFIVRTNMSSLWNFNVLLKHLETLPKKGVYNGFIGYFNNFQFASGSGYIMTPDIGQLLLQNRQTAEDYPELDDVAVGYTLHKLGINPSLGRRNDSCVYDERSYHYRFKNSDRSVEKNNMLRILNLIEIITSDKYLEAFPSNYFKTDCIVQKNTIYWRGKPLSPPNKESIIISGHSDYGITNELVEYYNPKIWWSINKQTSDVRLHALPLGITNNTNESELHPIYGNLNSMIKVMNEPKQDKNLVFMNFNLSTHPERSKVFGLFQDKEWVTKGIIENTLDGRTRFLREIRNHTFVLCPRGNGIDTHRLWETLYMGSIPIVKRDIGYSDFEDLPICFIDSWDDVNPDFLNQETQRILSGNWNMDKLKVSYWIQKIKESILMDIIGHS